jgi:DUF1680 family protein
MTPCCIYANAKLARYLTSFTADVKYGDRLGRVLFNTILGAFDPDDDGSYFYYSDYQAHAKKSYYERKWPCCAGRCCNRWRISRSICISMMRAAFI